VLSLAFRVLIADDPIYGTFALDQSSGIRANVNGNSDQELIQRCLSGRQEAFGLLVERYQHRLYHSLVHMLGSKTDAQDVSQDAFVHALEKLATFRGQSAFYSWLFRIAMNAAVSSRRKTRRMSTSVEAARERAGVEPEDHRQSAEPSHALDVSDRQRLVRQALGELPEEFRTVLVLKEMDGMPYEQIAEVCACPVGTVRSRLHRARLELRGKLSLLLRAEE
jgi:RNA polymerase sigma-70 factor (ECF subfamily)